MWRTVGLCRASGGRLPRLPGRERCTMDTSSAPGTAIPVELEPAPHDPDAHWAVPALQRLQALHPPASGLVGDADYFTSPPPRIPDRQMPPPPKDQNDAEAMRKWLDHCWALRNLFGSGN